MWRTNHENLRMFANAGICLGAANTVSQMAVLAALKDSHFMKEFETAFDYRRKAAYEILNQVPEVSVKMPESGFLCWVDVSKLGNSPDIVSYLVKEAKASGAMTEPITGQAAKVICGLS